MSPATMSTLRYAITDRTQYAETEPERHSALVAQAERLATEGVDYIQLREKDLPAHDLIGLARKILNAIREVRSGTKLLVNSRADIALAAGADGVHLPSGAEQLTPVQICSLFEAAHCGRPTVSVSCHTLGEVRRAQAGGADLVLFGPVFGKSVGGRKVVPEAGIAALEAACSAAGEIPVLALGGVTVANSATTAAVGARGIAAIRLFR